MSKDDAQRVKGAGMRLRARSRWRAHRLIASVALSATLSQPAAAASLTPSDMSCLFGCDLATSGEIARAATGTPGSQDKPQSPSIPLQDILGNSLSLPQSPPPFLTAPPLFETINPRPGS